MRDIEPSDPDVPTLGAGSLAILEHRVAAVEATQERQAETLADHGKRFDALVDDSRVMREDVSVIRDRTKWLVGGASMFLAAAISAGFFVSTRMMLGAMDTTARTTQEERLEAIADRIEAGDLSKTKRGEPRLIDLQSALPTVRGISRSERAAACLRAESRVPGVCSP